MRHSNRGRRRLLDRNKKTQVCDLVARGATIGEAAAAVSVSIRTVQREARRDPDFDEQLRSAHAATPDPLTIMQSAARTHWRAAAWLLERTDPENYGRRPASSCGPQKFAAALRSVLEAALEVAEPEQRAAMYEHVQAACETAFTTVFPTHGPFGRRLQPELPASPLADAEQLARTCSPCFRISDRDDPADNPPIIPRSFSSGASAATRCSPGLRPGVNDRNTPPANPRPEAAAIASRNPRPEAEAAMGATPRPEVGATNSQNLPPKAAATTNPADARLPWQYALRFARTAHALLAMPPAGAADAARDESIPSPKTLPATNTTGDENNGSPFNAAPAAIPSPETDPDRSAFRPAPRRPDA